MCTDDKYNTAENDDGVNDDDSQNEASNKRIANNAAENNDAENYDGKRDDAVHNSAKKNDAEKKFDTNRQSRWHFVNKVKLNNGEFQKLVNLWRDFAPNLKAS